MPVPPGGHRIPPPDDPYNPGEPPPPGSPPGPPRPPTIPLPTPTPIPVQPTPGITIPAGGGSPSLPAAGPAGQASAGGLAATGRPTTDRPSIMPIGYPQDRIPPGIVAPVAPGMIGTVQGIKQQLLTHSPGDIFKTLVKQEPGQPQGQAAEVLSAVQPLGGYQNPGLLTPEQQGNMLKMEAGTYKPGPPDFFPVQPPEPNPNYNGIRNPVSGSRDLAIRRPQQVATTQPPTMPVGVTQSPDVQKLTVPGATQTQGGLLQQARSAVQQAAARAPTTQTQGGLMARLQQALKPPTVQSYPGGIGTESVNPREEWLQQFKPQFTPQPQSPNGALQALQQGAAAGKPPAPPTPTPVPVQPPPVQPVIPPAPSGYAPGTEQDILTQMSREAGYGGSFSTSNLPQAVKTYIDQQRYAAGTMTPEEKASWEAYTGNADKTKAEWASWGAGAPTAERQAEMMRELGLYQPVTYEQAMAAYKGQGGANLPTARNEAGQQIAGINPDTGQYEANWGELGRIGNPGPALSGGTATLAGGTTVPIEAWNNFANNLKGLAPPTTMPVQASVNGQPVPATLTRGGAAPAVMPVGGSNGYANLSGFGPGNDLQGTTIAPVSGPDRAALASKALSIFDQQNAAPFQGQIRQIGQAAAKFGRIGSGMVNTNLADLGTALGQQRSVLEQALALDAAQQQLADQAALRGELRGERGYQAGQAQQAVQNYVTQQQLTSDLMSSDLNRRLAAMNAILSASTTGAYDPVQAQLLAAQMQGNQAANTSADYASLLNLLGQQKGMTDTGAPATMPVIPNATPKISTGGVVRPPTYAIH